MLSCACNKKADIMPLTIATPKVVMKLIGSLTSPYVRKARIVLAEKHIGYNFELEAHGTRTVTCRITIRSARYRY